MTNLKHSYFAWLYNIVDPNGVAKITKLCYLLYSRRFTWFIPNDDNRCQDGIELRETFLDQNPKDRDYNTDATDLFMQRECSVLEVLVGIAKRIDFIMYDQNQEELTAKWFAMMVTNLGLQIYTDEKYNSYALPSEVEAQINEVVYNWLERRYDDLGTGSIFPLKKAPRLTMRRTEIWMQMQAYIQENFED